MVEAHHAMLTWGWTLVGIVYFFLIFWPAVRIMHRIGRSGWWSLLILARPGAIIGLWLMAYARWPAIEPRRD
jgi:uncharacterized membrane protein YhaH (DUF805 family)